MVLEVTVTMDEVVQPFAGLVDVSVYVPLAETTVVELLGVDPAGVPVVGPVQANDAPPVLELPLNVTVELVQVIVGDELTLRFGNVVLELTTYVVKLVHPLMPSLTANV